VLAGDVARLNWNPDVTNCNGTLLVFEIVYSRACGTTTWAPLFTNTLHSITGCRSSDSQYLDVSMGSSCSCWDYKIEIYRNGQTQPDYVRSSTNDADLSQHKEQLLAEDSCPNDAFASCTVLNGGYGSRSANNTFATKEAGEPNHAGNVGGKSLWFCWTAPNNQPVTIDTIGSSFDTLLAVYTGNALATLSVVASNDDIVSGQQLQSTVTFTPTSGTTYRIAVDGYGGASGIVTLNWDQSGAPGPDLIIWGPAASPTIISRTFSSGDCEVVEGCETPGTHRLLSFTTETRNIGAGDLIMGNPATNSLFEWAACHGHYHFEEFADYELVDTNGNSVASGHKVGFCLEDVRQWSPTASPSAKYNCGYQGIQSGWADVYAAGLPCQYIDITDVLPGNYTLRMTVNPAGLIAETTTNNNVTLVPITISPSDCIAPPDNDNFANATAIPTSPSSLQQYNDCATKESGEPNHAGNAGGHSVWFTWSPDVSQTAIISTRRSDFDTLLGVYTGNSVSALSLVTSNDNVNSAVHQSVVSFPATAGTVYHIAVDGYNGALGTVVLNINPPANDDLSSAFLISGVTGSTNGYNIGASKESGEPAHAFDVGGHSIWYQWTAPADGPVEFNTDGSSFDTTLAVYTGTVMTNLVLIASNDDEAPGVHTSRLSFSASSGTTYQIAIDGYAGATGTTFLNWNMVSVLSIAPTSGGVQVNFSGVNGQRYGVLMSTDFISWSTQATRTMSGGTQQYLDDNTGPIRVYRTVLVP
jgi:hypothetical protein